MSAEGFDNKNAFSEGDTQTFNKASDDNKALYDFAGGEEVAFEFKRTASMAFSKAQKRMKWWSISNTRLIVYGAFFLALTVFSVYYFAISEYVIAAFAALVATFMLYIVLFGYKLFAFSIEEDDNDTGADISCKICNESIYLMVGNGYECIPLSGASAIRSNKKYFLITFKNSKLCPGGVIFELNGADLEGIRWHIKG